MSSLKATATAHASQALIAFHGFIDHECRVLPVDTLFCTLEGLTTTCTIELLTDSEHREAFLNNTALSPDETQRVARFVRDIALPVDLPIGFRLRSSSNIPPRCGLGSSGAAFASIAKAIGSLSGITEPICLSTLARYGSLAAAASVVGGIARLYGGANRLWAERILNPDILPFHVFAIPSQELRDTTSLHIAAERSPFFTAAIELSARATDAALAALKPLDFPTLTSQVEAQMLINIALISTGSRGGEIMWRPMTLQLYLDLQEERERHKTAAFVAMNSGPSIFFYTLPDARAASIELLGRRGVIPFEARPGDGAIVNDWHLF